MRRSRDHRLSCELRPRSEKTSVKNIPDYNAYFNQLYEKSFASTPQVPWTGFGYTYDWSASDGNVVGESEFILSPQSAYEVAGTYKTMDYCSP